MIFECSDHLEKNKDVIISAIAHSYETGVLEQPEYAVMFASMLSLLCENKVEGKLDEKEPHLGPIWKLTPEYQEELLKREEALASENVVAGPW